MKGCVAVLLLLALAGTVSSWHWQIHVIIYLIARNAILPFSEVDEREKYVKNKVSEFCKRRIGEITGGSKKEQKKGEEQEQKTKKDKKDKKDRKDKTKKILTPEEQAKKDAALELYKKVKEQVDKEAETEKINRRKFYVDNVVNGGIQQGFRILDYLDDLASQGRFKYYLEKVEKETNEELNIKDILSHPIGMAGWPDHVSIKDPCGFKYEQRSHYYDQTYNKDGSNTEVLNPFFNVITTLEDAYKTLVLYNGPGDEISERKAHMLSYLIHMMGDIHQPFHMITRCESKCLICDNGGNGFFIEGKSSGSRKYNCLHQLWGHAMLYFHDTRGVHEFLVRYRQDAEKVINEFHGARLGEGFKITELKALADDMFKSARDMYDRLEKEKDFEKFLKENPIGTAFKNLKGTPPTPSPAYIEKALEASKFLIVTAGYSLSSLLKEIYIANHPPSNP
eukprot:TRINITY_DN8558_c0_g1_i2.p1 TRINITY_DN8558_c0_g1~~TRINITY_DN8558_c0_g1_i2.p1  ORF type:complete len:451 (+),score=22.29 TRINITY_DN8558_c0_g1_i2:374-1726(+)